MEHEKEAQLKQFEVLWAEIGRRSNTQQALIAATVTATSTVGALVVAQRVDAALLAVLAVISPVFGLLWLDHARMIDEIASFIRRMWPWSPNWEGYHRDRNGTSSGRARFLIFTLAVTIVFLGPACGGLIASFCALDGHPGRIAAWLVGLVLAVLFAASWAHRVVSSWPR